MALFYRPSGQSGGILQQDHYYRFADLCFRHLKGAYDQHNEVKQHMWIKSIDNDNPRYGREEYLRAMTSLNFAESEEFTQSLAALAFNHVWLLSSANFYRQEHIRQKPINQNVVLPARHCKNPIEIAKVVCPELTDDMKDLHDMRNTIMHFVDSDKKTRPLTEVNFDYAYNITKSVWTVYCALLCLYGLQPDSDSWKIQTQRYELP